MLILTKLSFHVVPYILVSLFGFASSLYLDLSQANGHKHLLQRAPAPRNVWIVCKLACLDLYNDGGEVDFPYHTYLAVAGTPQDGPLKIEIGTDSNNNPYVRVKDFTTAAPNHVPGGEGDSVVLQGQTTLTNSQFLDPDQGTGVVTDALYNDAIYRIGIKYANNLNTCQNFVYRVLDRLDIPLHPTTRWWFQRFDNHGYISYGQGLSRALEVTQYVEGVDKDTNNLRASFDTPTDLCQVGTPKRDGACSSTPIKGNEPLLGGKTEVSLNEYASLVPADVLDITATDVIPTEAFPAAADGSDYKISILRNAGALTQYISIGKDLVAGLGVAATVAGAVFVILDFVDGNWVGGAIGAVGMAAGLAAGFALSGPIGWIVGGALAALFAILPGLFQGANTPADRTDVQGIIQWKLFGDKDHTGNEQCQQGTNDVPANSNCTALYGAGTLSMALGMDNFDAIVFLTQFNQGYAMSIPEIAAAFYVVNETLPGDGSDKMATITCHNNKGIPAGRAGIVGADPPNECDNPVFALNRQLITLPFINVTADKVFNRIIPAPGGDCKLIAQPGDAFFPGYNITINGLPSSVLCGLNATVQVQGTTVAIGNSTDGEGAYVAPPPVTPFAVLSSEAYVCLIHGKDYPFCLPPGSYQKQSGLGFEIKSVDTLTIPPAGASLGTTWTDGPIPRDPRPPGVTTHVYTKSLDPSNPSTDYTNFISDMAAIDTNTDNAASFNITGPDDGPDPVCCLFSGTQFSGNVWCVGVGGGPTLPQWTNVAQSVSCHGGGNVWLYAQSYGDKGGALIRGNVEDLSNEPYGNGQGTFSQNVKALWVLDGNPK